MADKYTKETKEKADKSDTEFVLEESVKNDLEVQIESVINDSEIIKRRIIIKIVIEKAKIVIKKVKLIIKKINIKIDSISQVKMLRKILARYGVILILCIALIGIVGIGLNKSIETANVNAMSQVDIEDKMATEVKTTKSIPILMYHDFKPKEILDTMEYNASIISEESFIEQMDFLYKNGYKTITLKELECFLKEDKPLPEKSFMITFDDGYASNTDFAYNVLREREFKGVIFVITGHMTYNQRMYDGKKMSWVDCINVSDVMEIQSHSHLFHKIDDNGGAYFESMNYKELEEDLGYSFNYIDLFFKNEVRAIAYPYGSYNKKTISALVENNIGLGFTVEEGMTTIDTAVLDIPRYAIIPQVDMEEFKEIFQWRE